MSYLEGEISRNDLPQAIGSYIHYGTFERFAQSFMGRLTSIKDGYAYIEEVLGMPGFGHYPQYLGYKIIFIGDYRFTRPDHYESKTYFGALPAYKK